MPIGDMAGRLLEQNMKLFQVNFGPLHLPSPEQLAGMDTIEEVLMVGYPTGLWDEAYNLPLIRKGITATPPAIDFNNRQEFVVDMACLPGSSGSPVIRLSRDGDDPPGGYLLGVLTLVPCMMHKEGSFSQLRRAGELQSKYELGYLPILVS
jgi:hypothetical protein